MPEQILRADAARNRSQLIDEARLLFAERGLDVPLDEIARRAGVGNATLYRRFPTRCHLIAAAFADTLREIVAAAEKALAEPGDAWDAFASYLTFLCDTQAANRGIADLLTSAVSGSPELERLREQALDGLGRLIDRAKASGGLRRDFRHEDVVLILMANAGLIERTTAAPQAPRRHLGYVLDGLRAPARSPAAPAPARDQIIEAMRALGELYGCSGEHPH